MLKEVSPSDHQSNVFSVSSFADPDNTRSDVVFTINLIVSITSSCLSGAAPNRHLATILSCTASLSVVIVLFGGDTYRCGGGGDDTGIGVVSSVHALFVFFRRIGK